MTYLTNPIHPHGRRTSSERQAGRYLYEVKIIEALNPVESTQGIHGRTPQPRHETALQFWGHLSQFNTCPVLRARPSPYRYEVKLAANKSDQATNIKQTREKKRHETLKHQSKTPVASQPYKRGNLATNSLGKSAHTHIFVAKSVYLCYRHLPYKVCISLLQESPQSAHKPFPPPFPAPVPGGFLDSGVSLCKLRRVKKDNATRHRIANWWQHSNAHKRPYESRKWSEYSMNIAEVSLLGRQSSQLQWTLFLASSHFSVSYWEEWLYEQSQVRTLLENPFSVCWK